MRTACFYLLPSIAVAAHGKLNEVLGSFEKEKTWLLELNRKNLTKTDLDDLFKNMYSSLHKGFDFDSYRKFSSNFLEALSNYERSDIYKPVNNVPHCDTGLDTSKLVTTMDATHVSPL